MKMITKIKLFVFNILFRKEMKELKIVLFFAYLFLDNQCTVEDIPARLRVRVRDKLVELGETEAAAEIDAFINNGQQ